MNIPKNPYIVYFVAYELYLIKPGWFGDFLAAWPACGSSQTRDGIGAAAVTIPDP